jgi:hypothetical protein
VHVRQATSSDNYSGSALRRYSKNENTDNLTKGLLQIVWVEIGPNIRETSSGRGFQRIFPMKDTIFCAALTMVSVVLKTV